MILLDIVATALLVRSDIAAPLQKALQLVVIWVIPFIGPIIVIALVKENTFAPRARSESEASGATWLPGIGPESGEASGFHHGHGGGGGVGGHGGDAGLGGH